jgi:hypothetical protein
MSRVLNVVRLYLMNRWLCVWFPLLFLGIAYTISLAIAAVAWRNGAEAELVHPEVVLLGFFFGAGVKLVIDVFSFSQALGITRREFFFGTLLTFTFAAATYTALSAVFGLAEQITHGWGINGFFMSGTWQKGAAIVILFRFVSALLVFMIGFAIGMLNKRFSLFGAIFGVILTFIGVGAVLIAAIGPIVQARNANGPAILWGMSPTLSTITLWELALLVVLAGVTFLILRRATPS